MKFKNTKLRIGLASSIAVLLSASMITSCQKDASVTSPTSEATPSNSMTIANTSSSLATTASIVSAPTTYVNKSNITISGLSINCNGANKVGLLLQNCSNVHITNCKVYNSLNIGIQLYNCKNVTVDNCFITNVQAGVTAVMSSTIKVNNNQFLNMNGPFPSGNFVQFDNVNGGGNQINYNKCEDIAGVAKHPQDGLSVYRSNGLAGDSIQLIGNWIRGGQAQNDSGGGAGICLGDLGGSYQVARGNILVNPGAVGIQIQGGNHIKFDHNLIYGTPTAMALCGIAYANYSGVGSSGITVGYNKIKFLNKAGLEVDEWCDPTKYVMPVQWSTNILKASLSAAILPTTIITSK
ncbi:right-handed parallel beta-helix repeat-containing protein [Mucilaginibacter sp. McL0603]|uniref:right-handed parallel beta-helix repeat-containing protein n=1 Tax=Mucilaginibacter sp. McL0603 TaxID=3415670 RepID=UPI003CECDE85